MSENTGAEELAESFEAQRERLHGIAYRMLGSHADADDAVQETWVRLSRQDGDEIGNLVGWLTTVVGRISLDVLRARRTHPQTDFDDRLPIVVAADGAANTVATASAADDVAINDAVGLALLVVLDTLAPRERLAFVLHDLFGVPFDDIGRIVGRSSDAAKMMASRARAKVRGSAAAPADRKRQWAVVHAFLAAAQEGDFEALLRVLDPDVTLTEDGADVVVVGATEVAARAAFASAAAVHGRTVLIDGLPGAMSWRADGTVMALLAFSVVDDRIAWITVESDPGRLAAMDLPAVD